MKFSIISVAYNSAATIGDTLISVQGQCHPDIEHIVIDGASTDNTAQIVQQHIAQCQAESFHSGNIQGVQNHRSIKFISEPDRGIYDAMNKALRLATGDWIGLLNADDVYSDIHVLRDIAAVACEPGVMATYGDLTYTSIAPNGSKRTIRHWRAGPFAQWRLRFGWMPPHPTLYLSRALQVQVGEFDASFRIAADYDYILRLFSRPHLQVRYLPRVLVNMRVGGASNRSLRAMFNKSLEDWRALQKNRAGGLFTLVCKNIRKLPQFFTHGNAQK